MVDLSESIVLYLRERVNEIASMRANSHKKNGDISSDAGQDGICQMRVGYDDQAMNP